MFPVLKLNNISKHYEKERKAPIFLDINMEIGKGEIIALTGASGSGKSTLLHIAGLLEDPTSGQVIINNTVCSPASDRKRTLSRRKFLGFIYQFHYLLQEFSVLENVILPRMVQESDMQNCKKDAAALLEEMGLGDKIECAVSSLSGGEKQRVAVARGLINLPTLILADEPTGSLDPETSGIVFSLLHRCVKQRNLSAIIATHD
ncbi:unnamed protein product, partial [Ixodes pacificus]